MTAVVNQEIGKDWAIYNGDSSEVLKGVPDNSIHLSLHSPPFLALYTYSPTERDLGNSRTPEEFWQHYDFIIRELLRVTMPGRNACIHVSQVPAMLVRDGYIGMKDFRGQTILAYERAGWIYHGEVCLDKDPQAQAIRTHAKGLAFKQLKTDSSWLRPGLADYVILMRKPGENRIPILPDLTNDEWIELARPVWYGAGDGKTLNAAEARESDDEKHMAALQLETIRRCVKLWSNRGETVLSPCAGIGSEGVVSIEEGRKFVGCELKASYFRTAISNLKKAEARSQQVDLFSFMDQGESDNRERELEKVE